MKTASVIVEPSGINLSCTPDETLIESAWRHGYYWPTICGGVGECGACRCEIIAGEENTESLSATEEIFFSTKPHLRAASPEVRLACCLRVSGPVVIRKAGVKPR